MTKLHVAPDLYLPTEAATQTFLIVGKRGSGKSSTATRIAEQLIRAKVPIAVLDPVDVWWGLKAGADGTQEGGLEVYVFGGEHADKGLQLEPTAGTLMADTLVDHRINAVFVLRQFSNREKARFVSDFAEQLFKRNRDVLHLFCEEAHELMPQNPYGGEEEMLGRMLRLEKLGRTSGIGMTAITQRPASLNKNATTQAEVVVAHRLMGPQDRDAIFEWVKYHHLQREGTEFIESLPTLKTGEAWFWAPDFPEDKPVGLRRVQVLMPETFDSRRTPKPGEKRRAPKSLAPVDLDKLGERMAATRQRAEANDPVKLRAELAAVKKQLANGAVAAPKMVQKTVEVAVLKNGALKHLTAIATKFDRSTQRIFDAVITLDGFARELQSATKPVRDELQRVAAPSAASSNGNRGGQTRNPVDGAAVRAASRMSAPERARSGSTSLLRPPVDAARTTDGITSRQQRFLDAAATLTTLGVEVSRETVSAWVGVHPRGGSVGEELKALVDAGLLEIDRGRIRVTDAGVESANVSVNVGDAIEQAKRGLTPRQQRIFEFIVAEYPSGISREAIAEKMGIHPRGGSFGEDLGRLRGRGLIEYARGEARARDFLFAGAA